MLRGLILAMLLVMLLAVGSTDLRADSIRLTGLDTVRLADIIEQNETGGQARFLTYWSPNEPFPSFGIGHFIWVPPGVAVPFEPTFPAMVRFVDARVPAPDWLRQPDLPFPWRDRSHFYQAWSSEELESLRDWLMATKPHQAAFIVQRFQSRLKTQLSELPDPVARALRQRLAPFFQFEAGVLALLDYANFKGIGANPRERYQGQGWGLLDVLQAMPNTLFDSQLSSADMLNGFVRAARSVLKQRTQLAPPEKNEQRWLEGWFQRLDGYRALEKDAS
ncbi:MAG: hypothetical protein RI556_00335 [Hydrogenovibrio sp.]|uniref:hypothetical protein n=1 Tax=Hydrogenovibrio sp. TaxID=2065821 RepID=UPI0028705877|nr:hypothetical protein [Hydrogenovibrio sp.]MDR9497601.1 hypothetical protein [Hydrogenovibrio sp.]